MKRLLHSALVLVSMHGVSVPPAENQRQTVPQADQGAGAAVYALRANPELARQVNEALALVALPVRVTVPPGVKPEEYVRTLCGDRTPLNLTMDSSDDRTVATFSPCVRIARNVKVTAGHKDTLEGIAVRSGLRPTAADDLLVTPAGETTTRPADAKTLKPGDIVTVPARAFWTDITANLDVAADRNAIVSALAKAVDCPSAAAEDCLLTKGIYLLERTPVRKEETPFPSMDAFAGLLVPALESLPQPPPATSVPVAPEQWPYDVTLLAAIFEDLENRDEPRLPVVIGIADGGLASEAGQPLPADVFVSVDEDDPEPDQIDDDRNGYIDDILGAGVRRPHEFEPTGNVALCGTAHPVFASWTAGPKALASHGSIASSVAGALPLRTVLAPDVARTLPRIAFFRLLPDVCSETANFIPEDGDLALAFDYLHERADVVNVSYLDRTKNRKTFINAMTASLTSSTKIVTLAAGNDGPGDLDDQPACPACLGNPLISPITAARTIVVGAASRDLRIAGGSNWGVNTVTLFAPGEPAGALNVDGQDASNTPASTSYASPYVTLGAAILRSFGMMDVGAIRRRLAAATWPLDHAPSNPRVTGIGVLDLVKVAAVRHHAVEVVEHEPDGRAVRRTYVGTLKRPLKDLRICEGQSFSNALVQAIRLDEATPDGDRPVQIFFRKEPRPRAIPCRVPGPDGVVEIDTLLHGPKVFAMADVRHLQMSWPK